MIRETAALDAILKFELATVDVCVSALRGISPSKGDLKRQRIAAKKLFTMITGKVPKDEQLNELGKW